MPDDSPAPDAPAETAPPDASPQEAPPAETAAPETMGGPARPLTKRAPPGGWAYIGDQRAGVPTYTPGVPARDLTADDLADLEREGWDLKAILETGNHRASPSAAKALADTEET